MNYDNVYNDASGLAKYHTIPVDDAIKIRPKIQKPKIKIKGQGLSE